MKKRDAFLDAYREFRDSVDFTKRGMLPDPENLVWSLLMGVPRVPADDDESEAGQVAAVDQKIAILKAVFVEVNRDQPEVFINKGLAIYDEAGAHARALLSETGPITKSG